MEYLVSDTIYLACCPNEPDHVYGTVGAFPHGRILVPCVLTLYDVAPPAGAPKEGQHHMRRTMSPPSRGCVGYRHFATAVASSLPSRWSVT